MIIHKFVTKRKFEISISVNYYHEKRYKTYLKVSILHISRKKIRMFEFGSIKSFLVIPKYFLKYRKLV